MAAARGTREDCCDASVMVVDRGKSEASGDSSVMTVYVSVMAVGPWYTE
jgi:hypothetical protein